MDFVHVPVLLAQVLETLSISPTGIYVDGTVGGAGHAVEIAKRLTTGRLIGIDQDSDAVSAATARLAPYPATVVQGNFDTMDDILSRLGIDSVDGILLDLGVSSHQLDEPLRGFSYNHDAPLDMRMNQNATLTAADIVANFSEDALVHILYTYGDEKYARSIARRIVTVRTQTPIVTTKQLADIVASAVPAKARREKNPARRTFQAIRIATNDEMGHLECGLRTAFSLLKVGGRLAVITFHSLEDRTVKQQFVTWCQGCTCPPQFPVCVCGKTPQARLVTRKPLTASEEELQKNNRSRSAKLRVIERIGTDGESRNEG